MINKMGLDFIFAAIYKMCLKELKSINIKLGGGYICYASLYIIFHNEEYFRERWYNHKILKI